MSQLMLGEWERGLLLLTFYLCLGVKAEGLHSGQSV